MTVIGSSDLDVFPLGLGGNTFGWTSDKQTSFAVLDAFVAGGGNHIDTADSYSAWVPGNVGGESETILGEWTRARANRESVVIATKVSRHPQFRGMARANVLAAADASLSRLQTDYIDLYYVHYDDPDVPIAEAAGVMQRAAEGREDPLRRALQLHRAPAARVVHGRRSGGFRAAGGAPAALQPRRARLV